jgi:hypothetical protein
MNPLESIRNWFNAGDEDLKNELVSLTYLFHIDPSINSIGYDDDEGTKRYEAYLDSSNLNKQEIMQHTIYIKGLIDLGLSGRDSEEGWERARQRNEEASKNIKRQGHETFNANKRFMETYEDRKNRWIKWCNEWKEVCNKEISSDQLNYWYLVIMAPKMPLHPLLTKLIP